MKHKTWFRLILKAIGIYLIGQSIPSIVSTFSYAVMLYQQQSSFVGPMQSPWLSMLSSGLISSFLQIALGLYLLLGGTWLVNLCIPSNRPYCPECGYDISHHQSPQCPECGIILPIHTESDNP